MTDVHDMVVAERRKLADTLDALTDAQWATPSLCTGWTARDVVAHLVWAPEHSKGQMFLTFVKSGFNLAKFTNNTVRGDTRSGAELAAAFHGIIDSTWEPPGGFRAKAPLTDTIAHGQDIRRPLGLSAEFDPEHLRVLLDFVVSKQATRGFTAKGRTDGLRFSATDIDWSSGSGAEVRGRAEAVAMSLLGRTAALVDVEGDGVETLRSRI
jgi:uncharacterized protein (TIGR03083 family)